MVDNRPIFNKTKVITISAQNIITLIKEERIVIFNDLTKYIIQVDKQ